MKKLSWLQKNLIIPLTFLMVLPMMIPRPIGKLFENAC